MTVAVITAMIGDAEARLVAGWGRADHGVCVSRRCADVSELLAAVAGGAGAAALVSADLPGLDRDAVDRLLAAGVVVIGLIDAVRGDERGERLRRLGVAVLISEAEGPELVARQVLDAVAAAAETAAAPRGSGDFSRADPAQALGRPVVPPGRLTRRAEEPGGDADPQGLIVAVWGPIGSPGRTAVATGLAVELALGGASVLLVDADTHGPSIAQTLALVDDVSGLAGAVRAANQGVLDRERLARLAPHVQPGLRVLTGLSRSARWPELRGAGLDGVWSCARQIAGWIVVDTGFGTEADEELSFDAAVPRRNAATLSALHAADLVLAVGSADPVGLHRLVRGLQDLAEILPPGTKPEVVITRVRASAVGSDPQGRITRAMGRFAGVPNVHFVADDRAGYDRALLLGRSLAEVSPGSPARRALQDLTREVIHSLTGAVVLDAKRSWRLPWRSDRRLDPVPGRA